MSLNYPVVYIFNSESKRWDGYMPDTSMYASGDSIEKLQETFVDLLESFVELSKKHGVDIPSASSVETVAKKWLGYKVMPLCVEIEKIDEDCV